MKAKVRSHKYNHNNNINYPGKGGRTRSNIGNLTLEGFTAGPDRGMVYYQGRPLCDDGAETTGMWDLKDATVVCRTLGFSRATKEYSDACEFGPCPPKGIPFAMSGFGCIGNEKHIVDCPHDGTVASNCGNNGVTAGDSQDIVGVECA